MGDSSDMTEQTDDHSGHDSESPDTPTPAGSAQTGRPETLGTPDRVDWRGWLLVGLVVFSLLVMPLAVLYIPEAHWLIGGLGLSQRQAYVVFPMIPAIVLGLTAVWATLRAYD